MIQKTLVALTVVLFTVVGVTALFPASVGAASTCSINGKFLTFKPWYDGLQKSGDCDVKSVVDKVTDSNTQTTLNDLIWIIIANVVEDLFNIVAYVTAGFIMWGGFLFMTSAGNPDRATQGRKTLINAVVGLVIAMAAGLIVNYIGQGLKI